MALLERKDAAISRWCLNSTAQVGGSPNINLQSPIERFGVHGRK